jgi:predicted nucleotidyltransferase
MGGKLMITLNEKDIPSLTEEEVIAVSKLKEKVKKNFNVIKMILFGSKARGDHNKDSDVDLLILVEEQKTIENRNLLCDIQFEVLMEQDAPLMTKLENYGDWERGQVWLPLKNNVLEDGVEIEL